MHDATYHSLPSTSSLFIYISTGGHGLQSSSSTTSLSLSPSYNGVLSLSHTHMYYEEFFFHYVTSMEVCMCISRTPLSLLFVCLFSRSLFVLNLSLSYSLLCVSITRSRSGGGHIYIYTCLFPSLFRSVHTSPQAPYPIRSAQLNELGRN